MPLNIGLLGWCALMSFLLAVVAGQWQVLPLTFGMALMMEADHTRNHHPERRIGHRDIEALGFFVAVAGGLALRFW